MYTSIAAKNQGLKISTIKNSEGYSSLMFAQAQDNISYGMFISKCLL